MNDRRILLVAYHFGPGAATGALRWNAMAHDLALAGWTFDVITLARPRPDGGPATAAYEFAPGIQVFPVPQPVWMDRVLDAAVAVKHSLWRGRQARAEAPEQETAPDPDDVRVRLPGASQGAYRDLLASVDAGRRWYAERSWVAGARRMGSALARRHRYDAVIVSSPPHLAHLAGIRLSGELGIPFVADFRDPWIFGHPRECAFSDLERRIGPRYEALTMRNAALVICNTDRARSAVADVYPAEARKLVTLPNGWDALDGVVAPDRGHFRVAFTGWLYPFTDPRPLFAACARLRQRRDPNASVLRLEFMGTRASFGGVPLHALARSYGIEECFLLHPRAPRAEALRFQQEAAVLVVFDYPHPLSVPVKFYDHAQMRGSMLLIGNPKGALADAARRLGQTVSAPDDAAGIDATLEAALDRWRRGAFERPLDGEGIFDRRRQCERLAEILASLGAAKAGVL
ncbi:MAG: glycosyltransferase [Gemmatimonadetes bacterium]|nr:glycosyltransferase [Gemmatimonadota bacterium]